MQIVMGDEHTFDCWVSYKQPNGKVIAIKPHLAAWVDMRSRVIMGDVMCKDANSDILKQSLLKMIYSEPGGVPEYLYIDNGKDYTAKTMTGRDRNDRSGMSFDNETMGFYKSIGIKDDHRALPYEPWSKGQIERFFRTVCNKFTRWMKSYTGTLTGSKTSDKVDKDIKRMLERGELLTLEEFYEKWHEWLTTVYMHTEHSGLKKMGETYKKPYDCFMNEDRYFKAAPPKSYATMLMMKSENVLVRNIGITKWGYEYRSDELCDYIGRKVDIKYDPDDMAVLYVFDQKGKKIKEKVGNTPLADACIDAVEWGASSIYCIPVKAGTAGTIGKITEDQKGYGTFEVKGSPNNAYDIVVEVMDAGECNEGSFRYSLDGGNTFTEEMTIPITGEAELATTGLTAKFTDAEGGDSFMEGDRFTFSTTSPAMSNESVISAVESLINSPLMFEFVHIVGVSSKALWASLCTIANDFLTKYKRPLFFVCEARGKKADESLEDYVNAMLEERKGINNIYMQVVCSNSRYQRMDGRVQDINNAGIVTGLYGRAKESQSIGEVKSFPISEAKLLKLLPEGIEDYIETLDKAKYVTIRQYIGKEDYYVTSANMMSPEGSDYSYAEDVRVSNRLVKAVRAKALDELQVEVDPGDIETSITNIQEQINTPVEDAVRDKVISSGSVTIDTENLNILVDEKLDINITYVPMGHVREMNLTFAVENPYAAS